MNTNAHMPDFTRRKRSLVNCFFNWKVHIMARETLILIFHPHKVGLGLSTAKSRPCHMLYFHKKTLLRCQTIRASQCFSTWWNLIFWQFFKDNLVSTYDKRNTQMHSLTQIPSMQCSSFLHNVFPTWMQIHFHSYIMSKTGETWGRNGARGEIL